MDSYDNKTMRLIKPLTLFVVVLGILSFSNSPTQIGNRTDKNLIRTAREFSNRAIARKDTAVLASVWTSDYHVITSRNFEVSGRLANRDRFAIEFSCNPDVIYILTPENIQLFSKWNMAAENGSLGRGWKNKGNH